jgi:hypothetical protein
MTAETQFREGIARLAKSLYDHGFSVGSAGNISAAVADGLLITPTIPVWASSTRHVSPSLRGMRTRLLTVEEVNELKSVFG